MFLHQTLLNVAALSISWQTSGFCINSLWIQAQIQRSTANTTNFTAFHLIRKHLLQRVVNLYKEFNVASLSPRETKCRKTHYTVGNLKRLVLHDMRSGSNTVTCCRDDRVSPFEVLAVSTEQVLLPWGQWDNPFFAEQQFCLRSLTATTLLVYPTPSVSGAAVVVTSAFSSSLGPSQVIPVSSQYYQCHSLLLPPLLLCV